MYEVPLQGTQGTSWNTFPSLQKCVYHLNISRSAKSREWISSCKAPLAQWVSWRRRKFQIHVLEAFPLRHIESTWTTDMFKKSLLNSQVFSCTLCELSHVNTSLIYFCFFILILFVIVTTVAAPRRGRRLARDNSTRVAPEDRSRPHKHRRPHGQVALRHIADPCQRRKNQFMQCVFLCLWKSLNICAHSLRTLSVPTFFEKSVHGQSRCLIRFQPQHVESWSIKGWYSGIEVETRRIEGDRKGAQVEKHVEGGACHPAFSGAIS